MQLLIENWNSNICLGLPGIRDSHKVWALTNRNRLSRDHDVDSSSRDVSTDDLCDADCDTCDKCDEWSD